MKGLQDMTWMRAPVKTKATMMVVPEKSPSDVIGIPTCCTIVEKLWMVIPKGGGGSVLEEGLPWDVDNVQLRRSYAGKMEKLMCWRQDGKPWIGWFTIA